MATRTATKAMLDLYLVLDPKALTGARGEANKVKVETIARLTRVIGKGSREAALVFARFQRQTP